MVKKYGIVVLHSKIREIAGVYILHQNHLFSPPKSIFFPQFCGVRRAFFTFFSCFPLFFFSLSSFFFPKHVFSFFPPPRGGGNVMYIPLYYIPPRCRGMGQNFLKMFFYIIIYKNC